MSRTKHCAALLLILCLATWVPAAIGQKPMSFDDLVRQGYGYSPPKNDCTEVSRICIFHLQGPISLATVASFKEMFDARPKGHAALILVDSQGGDVEAAMALGRLIRAAAPVGAVVFQSDCLSSCVLTIAGATHRQLRAGRIGIHRPYSIETSAGSYADNTKRFRELERRIRVYLDEMNIPPALLDEMLRYEPQTMHLLTKDELSRFRLEGSDYIWQDHIDSAGARRYGLDKQTYLSRSQKADKSCTHSLDSPKSAQAWIDCRESIFRAK